MVVVAGTVRLVRCGGQLSEQLRRELLAYVSATSEERARLIGELTQRNPGMADLLADREADDTLRDRSSSTSTKRQGLPSE